MSAPAVEAARSTPARSADATGDADGFDPAPHPHAQTPPEPDSPEAAQSPSSAIVGAFDTIVADADGVGGPTGDAEPGIEQPARPGLGTRLLGSAVALTRGLTRPIAAMIVGGIVAGAAATSVVTWTMLSKRNAELAARSALAQSQAEQIAEQAAKIEALTREAAASPASVAQAAADPAQTASPAPPTATAEAAGAADAPASARVAPASPQAPQRALMVPASADQGGSGLCDVTQGKDAAKSMRSCLEWFNRADRGETRPTKQGTTPGTGAR